MAILKPCIKYTAAFLNVRLKTDILLKRQNPLWILLELQDIKQVGNDELPLQFQNVLFLVTYIITILLKRTVTFTVKKKNNRRKAGAGEIGLESQYICIPESKTRL